MSGSKSRAGSCDGMQYRYAARRNGTTSGRAFCKLHDVNVLDLPNAASAHAPECKRDQRPAEIAVAIADPIGSMTHVNNVYIGTATV